MTSVDAERGFALMQNIRTKGSTLMGDAVLDCLMRIASMSRGQNPLSGSEFRSQYAFQVADYFWGRAKRDKSRRTLHFYSRHSSLVLTLSKMVRVRVRVRVRVMNQSNKSAANKSRVYAVLGVFHKSRHTLHFYSRHFSLVSCSQKW